MLEIRKIRRDFSMCNLRYIISRIVAVLILYSRFLDQFRTMNRRIKLVKINEIRGALVIGQIGEKGNVIYVNGEFQIRHNVVREHFVHSVCAKIALVFTLSLVHFHSAAL